mmetsp:Transcript_60580/g.70881  ORF Transcript_60580/g.70881 Transcript_60580/m.70881 type:complete len:98 (+) Transcript_60580:351-644(+)
MQDAHVHDATDLRPPLLRISQEEVHDHGGVLSMEGAAHVHQCALDMLSIVSVLHLEKLQKLAQRLCAEKHVDQAHQTQCYDTKAKQDRVAVSIDLQR